MRGVHRERKTSLTIAALNARSLGSQGRLEEVSALLTDFKLDVLAINETWQREGETYEIQGYKYIGNPRKSKEKLRGGGVGFFIAENLRFKVREPDTPPPSNCEMLAISLFLRGQRSIHVVSTYLPPHESLPKKSRKFA